MSLQAYTGNKLETLVEQLAEVLERPSGSPMEPEIVIVQSKGMERWVSMQLATCLGVAANIRFPFPNAFIEEIFRRVAPDLQVSPIFDPRLSTWRIMKALPAHIDMVAFQALKAYLEDSDYSLKHLQLAGRIAETFDQYLIYRPELISAWESGQEDHWQAVLWRALTAGHGGGHRAWMRDRLLERLDRLDPGECLLPKRVAVFGVSYLPPFHVTILERLARLTPVRMFLLNPCAEYWGDIPSNREVRRLVTRGGRRHLPEDLHLQPGNSLLASLGTHGRDFFDLLVGLNAEEHPVFDTDDAGDDSAPYRRETLLEILQSDILHLQERPETAREKARASHGDRSIQIHSCHSPMREVEVLFDHLLEIFEDHGGLRPRDVIVMTPDIESYAPFIQAVFGSGDDPARSIPFSIADRSMRKESRIVDTFLSILDLPTRRMSAPDVLSLLECKTVRDRFGLTEPDLELVVRWVSEVRIRWGIDEDDRKRWCSPAFRENTWAAGLERLLLGYAMPGRNERLFSDILPYDHLEGGEASILGAFLRFADRLFACSASLKQPRSLGEWGATLSRMLDDLFLPDEDSRSEALALRQVLGDLEHIQEASGFDARVDRALIQWHLEKHLEREGFGRGFITGKVTFCSMLPMRSIPFQVVCLIGLNENAFPRQMKPSELDLMAVSPRRGDRSIRNDDRYLFLEAIISARETLYISYTGQSARDNSLIPPSVLVSELMDYIVRNFDVPGQDMAQWLLTRHRLQPFNPAYFQQGSGLFSYSAAHRAEAERMLSEKRDPAPFVPGSLGPSDEAFRSVSVGDLCRFFHNPSKFLLNKRLGLLLPEEKGAIEEAECFELGGLEKYDIGKLLVECAIRGDTPSDLLPVLKASGRLPHGTPGECTFKDLCAGVEAFARRTRAFLRGRRLDPLTVDLHPAGFRLSGALQPIYEEHLIRYRYAALKSRDHLTLWIMHLALNCARQAGYPEASLVIGLDEGSWAAVRYLPVERSEERLGDLLALYWEGLSRPLPFFPQTSLEYARLVLRENLSPGEAVEKVQPVWSGNERKRGEGEDPYLRLCFKAGSPLEGDFGSIARKVFQPLFESREEVTDHA